MRSIRARAALLLAVLVLVVGVACNNGNPPPTANNEPPPATSPGPGTFPPAPAPTVPADGLFLTNFAPHGYSAATGEVFGNRRNPSGAYNAYAVRVDDPTKVRSLTASNSLYGTEDTHRAVSDVSPDGRYMILTVERPSHFPTFSPSSAHATEADPGKGSYNEIWLATTDGTKAWQLTDTNAEKPAGLGVFWARFDWAGDRVVFAEIMRPAFLPEYFGGEQIVVAHVAWDGDTPRLVERTTIGNGVQFYEPYGFGPDGNSVVASSNINAPGRPDLAQIMLFPLDGSAPTRLTSALGDGYQEFAFLRPSHTGWVISSGYNGWFLGTDRWLVTVADPEATPTRVTRFADWRTGRPESGISGGMAFVDNEHAVVGFTRNGTEDAYIASVPGR